jgi:hypothetical protein
MKKFILAAFVGIAGQLLGQSPTVTPNINLTIPATHSLNWAPSINGDLVIIDNLFGGVSPAPAAFFTNNAASTTQFGAVKMAPGGSGSIAESYSNKGVANGYAALDAFGRLNYTNLGSSASAGTAGAFSAAPSPCTIAGQVPTQIDIHGNAINCVAAGGGTGFTALTGDVLASGSGSVASTLATVNSSIGTCGDATHISQVTLDAKGRTTLCTPVAITVTSNPTGTPLAIAGYLPGSGSTALTSFGFGTDATKSDLLGVRNLTATKSINHILNYDGYGSFANLAASTDCSVSGCFAMSIPTSAISESPYASYTMGNSTHFRFTSNGQQVDSYNNPACGPNSIRTGEQKQCFFNTTLDPAQVSSCFGITDTYTASGTYEGSPWAVHQSFPISTWVNGRSIHQAMSILANVNTGGDTGNLYSYLNGRGALIATSDEGVLHASFQLNENPPPFGTIVTGGPNATTIKSSFSINSNNVGDYFDMVSTSGSDVMTSGLLLSQVVDTPTNTWHVTTSDSHPVSTAIGSFASGCGTFGIARNAGQVVTCLVSNYGSNPHAWVSGKSACIVDYRYVEQVQISATGTGTAWQANHVYSIGDVAYDGTNYQEVTAVAGNTTSGATPPVWATTVGGDTLEPTGSPAVGWTVVALGANTTTVTVNPAYLHNDGVFIAQGGMCGHGMVEGYGSATPLAPQPWVSIPIQFSLDAHSFNYVAPYTGGQQGNATYPIPSFPGMGWDNYSRIGNTVTAYVEGGNPAWNGFVPPSGTTVVINTGNPHFDAATAFSNFSVVSSTNPADNLPSLKLTYNDNLSFTDGGSSGFNIGSITLTGYNNYSAPCRAETIQVLNTQARGANENSGQAWGDGSVKVEPNNCLWPVGGTDAQPNSFNSGYGGMRISSNVFTPPMINGNQMLKLGLTSQGNSGAPFISYNAEGQDGLGSMFGHGGTNLGHWMGDSVDWLQGGFKLLYSPLNGGPIFQIGNRPPGDTFHTFPFLLAQTDAGQSQIQVDQITGDINIVTPVGSGFSSTQSSTGTSEISMFLPNTLSAYNANAFFDNEFGYLTLSKFGRGDPGNGAWASDQTLSLGAYYGASFHAGALVPISQGVFPTGSVTGSSLWCWAAVAQTSVGHGVSTGNVCANASATLNASNFLFIKFFQDAGTQTFRIFRTVSPNHTAFPLGTICDNVKVALQGCNDIGQGVSNSDDPSTYVDTSGTVYGSVVTSLLSQSQRYNETLFTPASSSAACNAGDFADDASFHYVCTATNTWKRVALTTF